MGRSGAGFPSGSVTNGNSAAAAGGMETLPRFGLADNANTSGRLWINYTTAAVGTTISKLTIVSGGTGATTCTLARMCLFTVAADDSVTLVARTANQTGIGAATFTAYQFALDTTGGFPASYSLAAGTRYALGFLMVASTAMTIAGMFISDPASAPVPCRIIAGQADISTSQYAVGTLTTQFTQCYMAARP